MKLFQITNRANSTMYIVASTTINACNIAVRKKHIRKTQNAKCTEVTPEVYCGNSGGVVELKLLLTYNFRGHLLMIRLAGISNRWAVIGEEDVQLLSPRWNSQ